MNQDSKLDQSNSTNDKRIIIQTHIKNQAERVGKETGDRWQKQEDSENGVTPESWMLELWDWANELGINEDKIPHDADKLLELASLKIVSDHIVTLPEALCNLVNLKELWLECPNLKSLPRSIRQLKSLNFIEVQSDKITDLQEELPDSFIQSFRSKKLHISGIHYSQFYTPEGSYDRIAHIALIDVNDFWTEEALTELKAQSGVSMVTGLKTGGIKKTIGITDLKLVDCIVNCEIDDMKAIEQMLNGFLNKGLIDFIAFDYCEIFAFVQGKELYYLSSYASNLEPLFDHEVIRQITTGLIKKIPSDIQGLIVHVESTHELILDELNVVAEILIDSSKFNFPFENLYLNYRVVDKAEHFVIKTLYVEG